MRKVVPVITVDGPSGSGKGTLSQLLANKLNWHLLDSGALYRVLAFAASYHSISFDNQELLANLARNLDVRFQHNIGARAHIFLGDKDITYTIRTERCGNDASLIAQIPEVRSALLARQRSFRIEPGLVADGRDMGTVVFPDAHFKVFLEASGQIRAQRRYDELQEQGVDVSLEDLLIEIEARDIRDRQRAVSPLLPAEGAFILDTSNLTITQVFKIVMDQIAKINFFAS